MGERIKAFWLGIFIIIGIAITAWLILFLKPSVGDGKLILKIRFSNIDKIEVGTRVTFAGKPVGEVKEIVEVPNPRQSPSDGFGNLYIYELTLKVDSSVHVYSYDEIIFATSGLLGEKSIAIIPKVAPLGAPPPQEVKQEILFARSTDKLEETLYKLIQVAETIGDTMNGVDEFISTNTDDFNATLKSLTRAADQIHLFIADATEKQFMNRASLAADALATTMSSTDLFMNEVRDWRLVEKTSKSLEHIYTITGQIANAKGTLGRLIQSDSLYLQTTALIGKFDTMLNDINNYGLLFQYDKKWQRSHTARINQMKQLCTLWDFYRYFDQEIGEMSVSVNRIGQLLQTMQCHEIPMNNDCFTTSFYQLLSQIEYLQESLKLYTEIFLKEHCHNKDCQK